MNETGECKLYIVPTPIGNLEDITLRAIRVLKSVEFILCEDTRTSGHLLKHFGIEKRLMPHHAFNEHKSVAGVIARLKEGASCALISDAGTPGISDPGFLLVRACLQEGIDVECLPGASALLPALVLSGIPSNQFIFEGFLPHKKGRQLRLEMLRDEPRTMIFYESPFRLVKTLEQLANVFGPERWASVSRELTKIHEETRRGPIGELAVYYSLQTTKGEIVIVVAGKRSD
jgi:16S rRNA (cytidine1402-2'-O)-methyltransferase